MGNVRSTDVFYGNAPLEAQDAPFAAVDTRFCSPDPVRLHVKDGVFTAAKSGKALLRVGTDKQQLAWLLSASGETLLTLKEIARHALTVYAPATREGDVSGAKLFRVYLKIGEATPYAFEDSILRIDLPDPATGAHCKLVMEGEWRSKVAKFWLDRGPARARELVAKVHRPLCSLRGGYVLEVAGNADCALLALACALLDDALRKHRLEENRRPSNPWQFALYL